MTDVKKLRELLNRASAGPWEASNYLVFFADNAGGFSLSACPQRDDNAALIAGAVNALPALLDELERLRNHVAILKVAIASAERENDALRAERDRLERNRDMWRGQCERQAKQLEATRWQPISTAPRDGVAVLLRGNGDRRIADGYWLQAAYAGNGAWIWPYVHSEPVTWMPLPAAPSALNPTTGEGHGDAVL